MAAAPLDAINLDLMPIVRSLLRIALAKYLCNIETCQRRPTQQSAIERKKRKEIVNVVVVLKEVEQNQYPTPGLTFSHTPVVHE
jgi:hypothetical protein